MRSTVMHKIATHTVNNVYNTLLYKYPMRDEIRYSIVKKTGWYDISVPYSTVYTEKVFGL